MTDAIGIVLTAGLAGGFALLGQWQGRRSEHGAWRRDNRRAAYLEFLRSVDAATALWASLDSDTREVSVEDLHQSMATVERAARDVMLIGPRRMLNRAQVIYEAVPHIIFAISSDETKRDGDSEFATSKRISDLRNEITLFARAARKSLHTGR